MKTKIALLSLVIATGLLAQDANPTESVKLMVKTPVRLAVTQTLSSKSLKAGDTLS